jgi:SNF2 family DNA or RNA helicase
MPITISLTLDGNLEINTLNSESFSIEEDGVALVFPFNTIEKDSFRIVINPGGKLSDAVEYILSELEKGGQKYELDPHLKNFWESYISEKSKILKIKKGKSSSKFNKSLVQDVFKPTRKAFIHQVNGISHALRIENAANFSVPGSGKTQTALGAFVLWKKRDVVEKAMVIGPASCFKPWEDEAKECLRYGIKIIRWIGGVKKRRKIGHLVASADLILITYQTACNDYLLLEQVMRQYKVLLILDESHHVKNPNGVRANMVMRLSPFASKRLILTGTPAPHSLIDIWTQFSFLWPSQRLMGDYYGFKQELEQLKNPIKKFRKELRPFFIRTTKKELGLPDIKREIRVVKKANIPFEQKKIIELLELKTLVEARKLRLSDKDMDLLRKWRTARIIRLLQAASNPALLLTKLDRYCIQKELDVNTTDLIDYISVFTNMKKTPAKIDIVVEEAKSLIGKGEKIVIWTWFVENIKLLSRLLQEYKPLLLYGDIKPYEDENDPTMEESRERNIRDFKERKDRYVLLANPAACAESISLHKHCQHAIYLDRNFNCGQFIQSMDRIHRVGMPAGLTAVYHIPIIDCAIERSVDKRLKKRQQVLYELLRDPMPVLGVDDESWLADSNQEVDEAFDDVLKEIKNEEKKHSL